MSAQLQNSLGTLIDLRTRELEKCQAELAARKSLCARVETNIERLGQLMESVSTDASVSTALAINTSAYKQSMLELVEAQRHELVHRQAEAAQAQLALNDAARQQEVLAQLLKQTRARALLTRSRQAQKVQDDLATQVWMRKST